MRRGGRERRGQEPRCQGAIARAPISPADATTQVPWRTQTSRTLVLATPISGPALMWTPQSVSREMELPTVLVMPTVSAPRSLQYRSARSVSAVSPTTRGCYQPVSASAGARPARTLSSSPSCLLIHPSSSSCLDIQSLANT